MKNYFLPLLFVTLHLPSMPLAQFASPFQLEFKEIHEGIYLGYRPDALREPVVGNVVILINRQDVLVYDAGRTPATGRQVVAKIRELTDKPLRYVIISHGHIDHIGGLQEYLRQYPHAEIISRPETQRYIRERVSLERYRNNIEKTLAQRDSIFALVVETEDSLLVEVERRFYYQDAEMLLREYQQAEVFVPTFTFTGEELSLSREGREVKILWLGHGKTQSDILLWLPREKIAIAGDMVTHPVPYGFCSEPEQWAATLDKLLALGAEKIIPGHGGSVCSIEYVRQVRSLLDTTAAQVLALQKKGNSEEEILHAIDRNSYQSYFAKEDRLAEARFQEWFLKPLVERLLRREK